MGRVKQRCGGIFVADPTVPPDPLDRSGLQMRPVDHPLNCRCKECPS